MIGRGPEAISSLVRTVPSATYGYAAAINRVFGDHFSAAVGFATQWSARPLTPAAMSDDSHAVTTETASDVRVSWHGGCFFADAIGSGGTNRFGFRRAQAIGELTDTVHADWADYQISGAFVTGAHFPVGRFFIQPSNVIAFTRVHGDVAAAVPGESTNVGTNALNVNYSTDTASLVVGYAAPYRGGHVTFAVRGASVTEFDAVASALRSNFVRGAPGLTTGIDPLGDGGLEGSASIGFSTRNAAVTLTAGHRGQAAFASTDVALTMRADF